VKFPGPDLSDAGAALDALLDDPRWDRIASLAGTGHLPAEDEPDCKTLKDAATPQPVRLARLGRPSKRWDPEAALDLWLHIPAGYKRDRSGRWRYETTGLPVPGACDLTLATLFNFPADDDMVFVPVDLAHTRDELAWCTKVEVGERALVFEGRAQHVFEIPLAEWAARCHAPLGLNAPELAPENLLDMRAVARLVGVSKATVARYFHDRNRTASGHCFPEPVARFGGVPVWSAPVIRFWLASRPGQGAGGGPKRRPAPGTKKPRTRGLRRTRR
jgi:predicted DNA-binding transcriptional regulator AlpA